MNGKEFCESAKNAYHLITRNGERFAISIGMFGVLVFGILISMVVIITVVCLSIMYLLSFGLEEDMIIISIVIILLIGIFSSNLFMSVWGMIAETLVHCFCIDVEVSQNNQLSFAPDDLKAVFNKKLLESQT